MPKSKAMAFDCINHQALTFCHKYFEIQECQKCVTRMKNIRQIFEADYWSHKASKIHLIARLICISKDKGNNIPIIDNIRPIVACSYILKLIEKPIFHQLKVYVDNFLNDSQVGFRSGMSTKTNHDKLLTRIDQMDKKGLLVFFDFSTAFETIDRAVLLKKIEDKRILSPTNTQLLKFILTNLEIEHGGRKTKSQAGVPQGLSISPLLLIIYIDDLLVELANKDLYTIAYADDICSAIRTPTCLTKLTKIMNTYCDKHNLKINRSKSGILILNKQIKYDLGFRPTYADLPIVSHYKFLGITTTYTLNLKTHINSIKHDCIKIISTIRPFTSKASIRNQYLIFNTLIMSKINYCNTWTTTLGKSETDRNNKLKRILFNRFMGIGHNICNTLVDTIRKIFEDKNPKDNPLISKSLDIIKTFNTSTDKNRTGYPPKI